MYCIHCGDFVGANAQDARGYVPGHGIGRCAHRCWHCSQLVVGIWMTCSCAAAVAAQPSATLQAVSRTRIAAIEANKKARGL